MKEFGSAVIASITILGSLYLICQTWEKTSVVQEESYLATVCKVQMDALYYGIQSEVAKQRLQVFMDKLIEKEATE